MSGISPAAAMILVACGVMRNFRNATAWAGCCEDFETEKPSPANWTTPVWGLLVYGGRIGATFEPSAFSSVAASQLSSMIIAALPCMNVPRMFVFVRTSLLVQPFFGSEAQFEICATMFGEVHAIWPVYSPFHWLGGKSPG